MRIKLEKLEFWSERNVKVLVSISVLSSLFLGHFDFHLIQR